MKIWFDSYSSFGLISNVPVQPVTHCVDPNSEFGQNLCRRSLRLLEDRHEDVLHVPLAVAIPTHHLLGLPQYLLCLLREIVRLQYHFGLLPCVLLNPDVPSTVKAWSRCA